MLTSKNSHNLKVERFYSVGIFRMSSPRDSISSNLERTAPRRWGEEPGYIEALQQRAGSLNIKIIEIRYLKKLSAFLSVGRCKSLGSLKPLLLYARQLSWASIPCVFSHLGPVGAHGEEWLPSWWLLDCRHFFLRALRTHSSHWRTAIIDVCDILVYWQQEKISQVLTFPE